MVSMTGRAVGQGLGQGLGKLMSSSIGIEIIYSFVIILCSLMIYFGTRELYKLSSHKGIKYFRQSFLFFALAYFFRSFIKIILFYFDAGEIRALLPIFGNITLFIFMYFSSMAIFYLIYSVMWKKWKSKSIVYLFHLMAFAIAIIIILFRNQFVYLLINLLLFVFIAFIFYKSHRQSKKKKSHHLYIIYLLLFVFWIFNIIDILIPNYLQTFQLFIYLISLGIFLSILYKVIRRIG
ncbi:MAG: hypothetical protein KJ718_03180 [Nanoarchaeota archaeon]|nr:hypothetical protein [Nanoarchaeota archaeon]MBU1051531.1 hypothetical protein [Nanoarchaeota archaeon]